MAHKQRDRIGLIVLVGLFLVLGLLLFFTVERPTGELRGWENNVLVETSTKKFNSTNR